MWNHLVNWLADHALLISASVSLALTTAFCFGLLSARPFKLAIAAEVAFTVLFSAQFFVFQFFSFPPTVIPVAGVAISFIVLRFSEKPFQKKYSFLMFGVAAVLFLVAMNLAKSSANTWGSGGIFIGVFMLVYLQPLFQLLLLIHPRNNAHGIVKIVLGAIVLLVLSIWGFSQSDYDGSDVYTVRTGIVAMAIGALCEGLVLYVTRNRQMLLTNPST